MYYALMVPLYIWFMAIFVPGPFGGMTVQTWGVLWLMPLTLMIGVIVGAWITAST